MSAGLSGSYAFNSVNLTLQPSQGQWNVRQGFGYDGNGNPVYSGVREFEMSWDFISMSDFNQLISQYNGAAFSGTVVVDLPKLNSSDDRFYSYSGCTLFEPSLGPFFMGYPSSVKLVIGNIKA